MVSRGGKKVSEGSIKFMEIRTDHSRFVIRVLIFIYRVTQNKVHHLLVILYLILEVNNTQVSYVVQCIIANEVKFNEASHIAE